MNIKGKHYRTIWPHPDDERVIQIIDQRHLPHRFVIEDLKTLEDFEAAIRDMHVRGAPLIGSAAAYGMYVAALQFSASQNFDEKMREAAARLKATRPTAVNLAYAVDMVMKVIDQPVANGHEQELALVVAHHITEESVAHCRSIGEHGLKIIEEIHQRKLQQSPPIVNPKSSIVNILTHCNAGWLACIDHGTATAPIYAAHDRGIPVHVWVDETRPRNQGASLTAFELAEHGVPHTVIADNTGGHLMQHGMVDMVIVGTDRTTRTGEVANKIGTYLKALAAADNGVPFYVGVPSSSIDWSLRPDQGRELPDIPIEERDAGEVHFISGLDEKSGEVREVRLTPKDSPAANYAFDVTPARLVTGLITERGVCAASEEGLVGLFAEQKDK
ncbi:MAG: S-methyl-5-thioribose-1-phosphate isomerase [Saprospiraceae bacterium]|nr:S-methyl-5-thioribose-1-phosphate isomerase [Saprospiraceae bacterium]MCF8249502.1 S-methyl-5-thioribose-1-phosphate isomerase [Saprospiraceae bacterium]MCF8280127.1 S-methyl-5-thioribose-1-phosphate isomerase [Bacteroidales bacterium]MCF8310720.1 S-methyl-5-thioribose-1-phosphate isomerase [Saprospiraceae bacterium]MCF8439449.1 S-methyl-5-thioribose-1-phosphate isomerase [Saprospiraceae bacterium]